MPAVEDVIEQDSDRDPRSDVHYGPVLPRDEQPETDPRVDKKVLRPVAAAGAATAAVLGAGYGLGARVKELDTRYFEELVMEEGYRATEQVVYTANEVATHTAEVAEYTQQILNSL